MARDKEESRRLLGLVLDVADHDQTEAEAEQELISDGVDVPAFLARMHAAVREKQKEERLAWRRDALLRAEAFAEIEDRTAMFGAMSRAELLAEAGRHQAQLHFKNLEDVTDDDLRSQLADLARLAEMAKKT